MAVEWSDKYLIGEVKIDAEHREWFRLANDFLVAVNRQARQDSGAAFSSYTRQHFLKEETLMREVRFPFTDTHVSEHDRLFDTLDKIFDACTEEVLSKLELEEFVAYTLATHISSFDAQLSVYIRRNCPAPAPVM
jgi:hemerythrin-like metal-binding protein